jgi:hypothetical protein
LEFFMDILVAANWWEPNTSGLLDIGDITAFLVLFTAISGILLGISRWWMRMLKNIIHEEIAIATEPIHPKANGGLSLADVARKTTLLEQKVSSVEEKMTEVHDQNEETHKILSQILLSALDNQQKKTPPRSRAPRKSSE